MRAVPIIRYICLVGSLLLGMFFLLDDRDRRQIEAAPARWTSLDSLRAMAHLGEPVQGDGRNVRVTWMEQAHPEQVERNPLSGVVAQEKPLILNAQARMDAPKAIRQPGAFKPGKQRVASRQARVRTAVVENTPRGLSDSFRPPSW
jgi:hypothetical protein